MTSMQSVFRNGSIIAEFAAQQNSESPVSASSLSVVLTEVKDERECQNLRCLITRFVFILIFAIF